MISKESKKSDKEWHCHETKDIIPKEGNIYSTVYIPRNIDVRRKYIVMLLPLDGYCIKIPTIEDYGIKLTLRENGNDLLPDSTKINILKKIGQWTEEEKIECNYVELKRKFTPKKEIRLSTNESIMLQIEDTEVIDKIQPENVDVVFTVKTYATKEKEEELEKLLRGRNVLMN